MAQQLLHFFRIPFAPSASVFANNLALYLRDLKSLLLATFALKLVLHLHHKLLVASE